LNPSSGRHKDGLAVNMSRRRPMVWIRERAERSETLLVGIEMATSDTSGRSSPSRSRLMPTGRRMCRREDADNLGTFDGFDVRMQVAHLYVVLVQVFGESSAMRLVSVVTSTRSPAATRARISDNRSSTCAIAGGFPLPDRPGRSAARSGQLPRRGQRSRSYGPAWRKQKWSAASGARIRRSAVAGCQCRRQAKTVFDQRFLA